MLFFFENSWFKDGQQIKEGVKYEVKFEDPNICSLVIKNIKYEDAGTYVCKAYNQFGDAFDSAKVTVNSTSRTVYP